MTEPTQPQTIQVQVPRRGSSLGVASLVLGTVAFAICWVPLLGMLGLPLSGLGFVLGLIGILVALVRKGSSIGYPIAGTLICGVSVVMTVTMTTAIADGLEAATQSVKRSHHQRNRTNQQVVPSMDNVSTPTQDAVTAQTPQDEIAEPAIEWASAESAVMQDDVQIRITSVQVGKVTLRSTFGTPGSSKEEFLAIAVELTNLSETKKLEYKTWAGGGLRYARDLAALCDNFDNTYKRIGFTDLPEGRTESASIYPGKSIIDVLVFESPLETVEHLDLQLPGKGFGGDGMIRLRIPASMIEK